MPPQRTHQLCRLCQNISIETLSKLEGLEHGEDSDYFLHWRDNCRICSLFAIQEELWYGKRFRVFLKPRNGTKYPSLGVAYDGGERSEAISFPLFTDEGDPATTAGIRVRKKPETPSSGTCYQVARAWIQECISNHRCSERTSIFKHANMDKFPARLVDLMAFDKFSTDSRLVDSKDQNVEFATLSYCWGTGMPSYSTTTLANIQDRQERMPLDILPQTLQDAIKVTRGLEIRYLWIDALCIIQDCRNDWATEAAKMSSIYGRSLVTIAVELSSDCISGFLSYDLRDDDPCMNYQIKIPNTLKNGKQSCLYLWAWVLCNCPLRRTKGLQDTSLSKRGWAYQERFLSPRILHYLGGQIIWECRESQGIPLESSIALQDTESTENIPSAYGSIAKELFDPTFSIEPAEILTYWYRNVVEEFCSRLLSQRDDKLPAISGIARVFGARLKTEYVCGLWMNDIAYGLSWGPHWQSQKVSPYRAPSFSWASVDGKLDWPGPNKGLRRYVCVEDYHIDLGGQDPFGCVLGGWIKLTGFLGTGIIREDEQSGTPDFIDMNSDAQLGYAYLDPNGVMGSGNGQVIQYLVLYTAPPRTRNACNLMLVKQLDNQKPLYERIGHAHSVHLDVCFDEEWFTLNCLLTTLTLF